MHQPISNAVGLLREGLKLIMKLKLSISTPICIATIFIKIQFLEMKKAQLFGLNVIG